MSTVLITHEARSTFDRTFARAASRQFIFEWSSRADAEQAIIDTFYTAAGATELAEGVNPLPTDRVLDANEARLAAAALNLAADGDYLVAVDEARSANDRLHETIQSMRAAPMLRQNYADFLRAESAGRARGWRRISASTVAREIRGLFSTPLAEGIDPRPGMNPIDAIFTAYVFNFQVGGVGEDIGFTDAQWASCALERAALSLQTYYP